MKEEFKIRTMGFGELAQMYNPGINPMSASNTLRRWINRNERLHSALRHSGYRKHSKVLTPRQVGILIEFLGPP
jgi:hypothetical protein